MNKKDLTLLPPEELFSAMHQLLQEGYDVEFTVTGNSMWPFLRHKADRVTICRAENHHFKKGDIVLLQGEQGYLLHRITHIKNDILQTAGDGNCYYDGYVPVQRVLGKVVGFTRKERYVSCSNPLYRLSSYFWRVLFPLRPILLRFLFLFRRRA